MVVTLNISHLFQHPVDLVIKTYLKKHEIQNNENYTQVEVIGSHQEGEMTCLKRRLKFRNYFPQFFRRLETLKRETVVVEEEVWSEPGEERHWLRSHDRTWENAPIAHLAYVSRFEENPAWTVWTQDTFVDLSGFGVMGTILELYLKRHFTTSIKADLKSLEKLMESSTK